MNIAEVVKSEDGNAGVEVHAGPEVHARPTEDCNAGPEESNALNAGVEVHAGPGVHAGSLERGWQSRSKL